MVSVRTYVFFFLFFQIRKFSDLIFFSISPPPNFFEMWFKQYEVFWGNINALGGKNVSPELPHLEVLWFTGRCNIFKNYEMS